MGHRLAAFVIVVAVLLSAALAHAVDFEFYGRSGNGIELDFSSRPGVPGGAVFSGLSLAGFNGHAVLTSTELDQENFSSTGQLWVFADPARNTTAWGDVDPTARGFQGTLGGSLLVNGQHKTFSLTVQPGYTGAGPGSVGQSFESLNDPGNNDLFVAQQQQRLRYLGFVKQGGSPIGVDGVFGPNTDQALRTFQAAFVAGFNTHRVGMDIDMHVDGSTWNFGNGLTSAAEQDVIDVAISYIDAGVSGGSDRGRIIRIISSNQDILAGINSLRPATATYFDSSGGHQNHLHLDIGSPIRIAGLADLPGDFNFDDQINGRDFLAWQRGASISPLSGSDLASWQNGYNANSVAAVATVPEPATGLGLVISALVWLVRYDRAKPRSQATGKHAC